MAAPADPYRDADDEARALARGLVAGMTHAALGVIDPDSGAPLVSRIALVPADAGAPLALVSDLSHHTRALRANPACSLLIGEPGPRGDPLTHPRLTVQATALFVPHGHPDHAGLAETFVTHQPKAKLYIGFADFALVRFDIRAAYLNGGFGKAYRMTAADILPAAS